MRNSLSLVVAVVIAAGAVAAVSAEDWPQWRGADRLAVWTETGIVEELPDELRVAWRTPIRSGYSGPAVADGRIFITDWMEDPESRTLDGTERALALDERTGEVLWTYELLAKPCGEAIFGLDKRRQDAGGQLRSTRG